MKSLTSEVVVIETPDDVGGGSVREEDNAIYGSGDTENLRSDLHGHVLVGRNIAGKLDALQAGNWLQDELSSFRCWGQMVFPKPQGNLILYHGNGKMSGMFSAKLVVGAGFGGRDSLRPLVHDSGAQSEVIEDAEGDLLVGQVVLDHQDVRLAPGEAILSCVVVIRSGWGGRFGSCSIQPDHGR